MNITIIGAGNIGSELHKRADSLGWNVNAVLRNDGIYRRIGKNLTERIDDLKNYRDHCRKAEIAFLAIPTMDDGRIAYEYIRSILGMGRPVVTCEKGALSNYFSEIDVGLGRIGYSATVGGGTRLLKYLEERVGPETRQMHAVLNGTLNYIFDEVSRGRGLGEVVDETVRLGYAEPGAKTPLDVINNEAVGDVPMKVAILFNICRLGTRPIRAKEIPVRRMDEDDLYRLSREAGKRRYIVSIVKKERGKDGKEDVIGGFRHGAGEWTISAGFKLISENPLYMQLVPSGVNNAVLIHEGRYGEGGTYRISGQGAGAVPTVSSMIKDAHILLKR